MSRTVRIALQAIWNTCSRPMKVWCLIIPCKNHPYRTKTAKTDDGELVMIVRWRQPMVLTHATITTTPSVVDWPGRIGRWTLRAWNFLCYFAFCTTSMSLDAKITWNTPISECIHSVEKEGCAGVRACACERMNTVFVKYWPPFILTCYGNFLELGSRQKIAFSQCCRIVNIFPQKTSSAICPIRSSYF